MPTQWGDFGSGQAHRECEQIDEVFGSVLPVVGQVGNEGLPRIELPPDQLLGVRGGSRALEDLQVLPISSASAYPLMRVIASLTKTIGPPGLLVADDDALGTRSVTSRRTSSGKGSSDRAITSSPAHVRDPHADPARGGHLERPRGQGRRVSEEHLPRRIHEIRRLLDVLHERLETFGFVREHKFEGTDRNYSESEDSKQACRILIG